MPEKKTIDRVCQHCQKVFLASRYDTNKGVAKYCSHKCRNEGNRRPIADRFFEKVERSNESGCWLWTGAKRSNSGHGGFWDGARWTHAHRVSYELANGPIPKGMSVCHSCDNPSCVNPAHLWVGTHAENMADAKNKNRTGGGYHYIRKELRPLGEKHGQSKLTDEDVRDIRHMFEIEGIRVTEIARQYGMTHAQIGMIARRKAWTHIK